MGDLSEIFYLVQLRELFPSGMRPELIARSMPFPSLLLCADNSSFHHLQDNATEITRSQLYHCSIPTAANEVEKRSNNSLLSSEELSRVLHSHGVNIRYIGIICMLSSSQNVRKSLVREMIIRTLKQELRKLMQGSEISMISFLNDVFGCGHSGDLSKDAFWRAEGKLYHLMVKKFFDDEVLEKIELNDKRSRKSKNRKRKSKEKIVDRPNKRIDTGILQTEEIDKGEERLKGKEKQMEAEENQADSDSDTIEEFQEMTISTKTDEPSDIDTVALRTGKFHLLKHIFVGDRDGALSAAAMEAHQLFSTLQKLTGLRIGERAQRTIDRDPTSYFTQQTPFSVYSYFSFEAVVQSTIQYDTVLCRGYVTPHHQMLRHRKIFIFFF